MTDLGFDTTTDEVLRGIDLTGTLALVTGASSGLGVETARALVAHGAEVIVAVRDLAKADTATTAVREAAEHGRSWSNSILPTWQAFAPVRID